MEWESRRGRDSHAGLRQVGVPALDGLQKHVGAHRSIGAARGAIVLKVKSMGTVAIQTQCCLKQEESDLDDDNGSQQSSTEMQLVDALRVGKPAARIPGTCNAPFATRAPSEASTIFVP